ncbi:hypothetical protein N431DRAFT_420210 [Stipitochalara longipes BDJ]|nr:hypothetical protein N431DRAFT_420210 [Stipitochalara longipes BDJ]
MGLSRSRAITLVVAIATLTSNVLSSILFAQLPDDTYHLASNFSWYLNFANVLSVFGFIGALRQHALSIALFSNYLIFDTILCAIPRFLLVTLLQDLSATICTPPSFTYHPQTAQSLSTLSLPPPQLESPFSWGLGESWSEESCYKMVSLAELAMAAGVIAATLLQFVGALAVREYAKALWLREVRQEFRAVTAVERVSLCEKRGLPVVFEEEELGEKCS